MTENSIKRYRKNNIKNINTDDEDIEQIQTEINETISKMNPPTILKKLKKNTSEPLEEPEEGEVKKIKIEVNCLEESQENSIEVSGEKSIEKPEVNTEYIEDETSKQLNIKIQSITSLSENQSSVASMDPYYKISDDVLREEFDLVSKETTSKADKLIEIHIKNMSGRKQEYIPQSSSDEILQNELEKWRTWHLEFPEIREAPIMYLCYICDIGFWHFSEFRNHTFDHKVLHYNTETQNHDFRLTVQSDEQGSNIEHSKTLNMPNCWKCGKDVVVHLGAQYQCDGCKKTHQNCMLLSIHEGTCEVYKEIYSKKGVDTSNTYKCPVCPYKHWDEKELDRHLTSHTVRSDLPINWTTKHCPKCSMSHQDYRVHVCLNQPFTEKCDYCSMKFQSKLALAVHLSNSKVNAQCRICNTYFKRGCIEAEHLLTHTKNYLMLYKCSLCTYQFYFLDFESIYDHRISKHFHSKKKMFFDKVIVPSTLLKKLDPVLKQPSEMNNLIPSTGMNLDNACQGEADVTQLPETSEADGKGKKVCNFANETKQKTETENEVTEVRIKNEPVELEIEFNEANVKQEMMDIDEMVFSEVKTEPEVQENDDVNYKLQLKDEMMTWDDGRWAEDQEDSKQSLNLKKSSVGGKRIKREDEEELVGAVYDNDERKITDEIERNRKLQNKIRCKRYREKKKLEKVLGPPISRAIPIEKEIRIKRRKERDKERSKRYRDKKRAAKLINLQTELSKAKVLDRQNFQTSQIPGPSTRSVPYLPPNQTPNAGPSKLNDFNVPISFNNADVKTNKIEVTYVPQLDEPLTVNYASNSRNIRRVAQNNTQKNLPVQTYSSFPQNSSSHREFQKDFNENDFGHVCNICDRLWIKKDLKVIANSDTNPKIQFIRTMVENTDLAEIKICPNCLVSINKKRVPPLAVYNGFKYFPLPENLRNCPLDLVTERLISPRILFMQIRRLRHNQDPFGIYGQAINVPIEVNTMVDSLPRNITDDHSITVHFKRKEIHKSNDLNGIVDKTKVKTWLRYFKDSPLYKFYGITIDDSFLNSPDDVQDKIIYDEDGDSHISEQIPFEESLVAQQQTLMWNEERYLRIAPGEANDPISLLFDDHAEELSFPQIYLGQFRTFRDGVTVTPYMIATSELRRSDRRGVTPQHLLYMAMKIMRIRIRDLLSFRHVGRCTMITKEQIESEDYVQDCIDSNLALRMIPNPAYQWSERKKDLFAMIRQYGKPTVFFTISANEVGWPKLIQLLHNLKYKSGISIEDATALNFMEKSTLVNEDAVTCAIYFNKLINDLMKVLQSKRFSPFKKYRVRHYFKRIEFKDQGSPHAHILAWLDNAPEDALEKDYSKAIDLIDTVISVSEAEASPNIKLQTHKHTFTCYEGVSSKRVQKCRFEAPFMPIKTTMILTPMEKTDDRYQIYRAKYINLRNNLENNDYDDFKTFYKRNKIQSDQMYIDVIRAGIDRPKVFPKRQPNEKWHDPFNPFILNIVTSHTDFQFIIDECSCAAYVVEYINKANKGISDLQRKIIEIMDEHPEFDIFQINKNITIDLLNHIEITNQEAAWYLLKEPTSKSSTSIVYIPTVRPIERQRIKKSSKELSELDGDCTDIWKENCFDKYEKRPKDLEDTSLAQFVSKFYRNNRGDYVIRVEPRIIRYRNYDMVKDFNEYRREMVTLHIPFRDEEADIIENMKFITLYDENLDVILEKRKEFESNVDIERILQICRELCREVSDNNEEIGDIGRLQDQNPFQELHNQNADTDDDLPLAMLKKTWSCK